MRSKRISNIQDPFQALQSRIEQLETRLRQIDGISQPSVPIWAAGSEPANQRSGELWIDDNTNLRYKDDNGDTRILGSSPWTSFTPHALQPSTLTVAGSNCWYRKVGDDYYYVRGTIDFNSTGTTNNIIYAGGNFPAPSFMDGHFVYFRSGIAWYTGYCIQDSTFAQFTMQVSGEGNRLGVTPQFAVGTNDSLQFFLLMDTA